MVNLFKIKEIFLKSIKWLVAIAFVALAILYYLEIQKNKVHTANYVALQKEMTTYRLKNGSLVSTVNTLQLEKAQYKAYIEAQSKDFKLLVDKFSNLKGSVKVITNTVIDSIEVPYEVQIPQPFTRSGKVSTEDYSFNYTVDNTKFQLSNFNVPDSLSIVLGTKKKWFWGEETLTADVINTNKYVKISNIEHVEKKQPKKFYETTLFKLGVGILIGAGISNRK